MRKIVTVAAIVACLAALTVALAAWNATPPEPKTALVLYEGPEGPQPRAEAFSSDDAFWEAYQVWYQRHVDRMAADALTFQRMGLVPVWQPGPPHKPHPLDTPQPPQDEQSPADENAAQQ